MEHQVQSEGRWMKLMFGFETSDPMPAQRSRKGFIEKYRADADRRLELLRSKSDEWWREVTNFFDVERTRAWIMARRINHSTPHRGQLVVYLRRRDLPLPSVYGPTAETGDRVIYSFDQQQPEER
jgi:uncharacterized damage-inducible protein DinB